MTVLNAMKGLFGARSATDIECDAIAPFFDPIYYLHVYADVKEHRLDPVRHYVDVGWKEGRDPCPWFSTSRYVELHSDVNESGRNPFFHYIKYGRTERRKIAPAAPPAPPALGTTVAAEPQSVQLVNATGLAGAVEVRARIGRRLAYISGWAVTHRGLRVRVAPSGSHAGALESLCFMQDRDDTGAARTDIGFRLLLQGDLRDDNLCIELTEDGTEEQRPVTIEVPLSDVSPEYFSSLQAETILKCHPANDETLPRAISHLIAARAELESQVMVPTLQRIEQSVPKRRALKVLIIARNNPRVSYFNLLLLTLRLKVPADVIFASLGGIARDFAATSVKGLVLPSDQSLTLIQGGQSVPSGPLVMRVLMLAAEQRCACLCVLDEVSIAPALEEIAIAVELSSVDPGGLAVQGWQMPSRWTESAFSKESARADTTCQASYPKTMPPVGVLLATESAAAPLSATALPPYPGRGWALSSLFAAASMPRMGKTPVIDLLERSENDDALCLLLSRHVDRRRDAPSAQI